MINYDGYVLLGNDQLVLNDPAAGPWTWYLPEHPKQDQTHIIRNTSSAAVLNLESAANFPIEGVSQIGIGTLRGIEVWFSGDAYWGISWFEWSIP
jgi:hypothetical protein